jgi:Putative quorum-sensing-regulated virulence factor
MATMPFGRYRGQPLSALPLDYLEWLLGVASSPWLRDALVAEHRARTGQRASSSHGAGREQDRGARAGASSPSDFREVVERSRRELARKYHPDVGGGGAEVMKGINLLADHLLGRNGKRR